MSYQRLIATITGGDFELSDMGDGTAVLTSFKNSKIISFNTFGTAILQQLKSTAPEQHDTALDTLAQQMSNQYGITTAQVTCDIETFLTGLQEQLGLNQR